MSGNVDRWVELFAKFLGNLQNADVVGVWRLDAHVMKDHEMAVVVLQPQTGEIARA